MPFFGGFALYKIVNSSNIDGGDNALTELTSGTDNVAIGNNTLSSDTTGSSNIAIGNNALNLNVSGDNNIAIGVFALETSVGSDNVSVGKFSGNLVQGGYNTLLGHDSCDILTSGSGNVAVGAYTILRSNVSCDDNTIIGYGAGTNNTVNSAVTDFILIGALTGSCVHQGSDNVLIVGTKSGARISISNPIGTFNDFTCVGSNSFKLSDTVTGFLLSASNIASFGNDSFNASSFGGMTANRAVSDVVAVGNNIQITANTSATNRVIIGNDIVSTTDNQIVIGDATHTSIMIGGLNFSNGPGISSVGVTIADVMSVSAGALVADDPGADRIVFWDDSAGKWVYLTVGSGLTITDTTISASGGGMTLLAPQTLSGQASRTFTFPTTAKQITFSVHAASGSGGGTAPIQFQLGDAGGLETSGYLGAVAQSNSTSANLSYAAQTGFCVDTAAGAGGQVYYGSVTFTKLDDATNQWAMSGNLANPGFVMSMAGTKSLSAALTQIAILAPGTTFDGGTVSASYVE